MAEKKPAESRKVDPSIIDAYLKRTKNLADAEEQPHEPLQAIDEVHTADAKQDIELKKKAHKWVSILITVQLVFSNLFILYYLIAGTAGRLEFDSEVLRWWIAGSVIQVVGLGYVIIRYLFGSRKNGQGNSK